MRYDVGIGEYKVSGTESDEIKTYALGSCVAVIVYDPQSRVAGMIHIALPDSKVNENKAHRLPGYFVDTGMPVFLEIFSKNGGILGRSKIKLAGGASIMDENKTFDIGRRNVIAIKRFLWKSGFGVVKEDVGGRISRTVAIGVSDGVVMISNSKEKWTI